MDNLGIHGFPGNERSAETVCCKGKSYFHTAEINKWKSITKHLGRNENQNNKILVVIIAIFAEMLNLRINRLCRINYILWILSNEFYVGIITSANRMAVIMPFCYTMEYKSCYTNGNLINYVSAVNPVCTICKNMVIQRKHGSSTKFHH